MIQKSVKVIFSIAVFFLLISCKDQEPEVYLFSYFKGNGEDGLHLAASEDGYHWEELNNGMSFLTPDVGGDKLMRDPCIIKGGDGKFHMVWTVSWKERGIGYANSKDLIHWSEQKYIPVMQHEPDARNCWAPEIFYDDISKQYLIFWSATIPGRFPETDSTTRNGNNHRIYYTTTPDFINFSDTQILYNQGFNVIDATIIKEGSQYIMFLKNETALPEPEKNIRIATSTILTGGYSQASEPITPAWVEGPTAVKINDRWIVYFDMYREQRMGAIASGDLKNWTNISDSIRFPEGTRHGTVFKVDRAVLENLRSDE